MHAIRKADSVIQLWQNETLLGAIIRKPNSGLWRFISRTTRHKASRKAWDLPQEAAESIFGGKGRYAVESLFADERTSAER